MLLDFAWKSYSSKPVLEKRVKTNKDNTIKLDKNGNPQYGNHLNVGALTQNVLGNGMSTAYTLTNFMPDKPDADNASNAFAKDIRNKADDAMLHSGVLPLMGVAVTDKLLGKIGWGSTGTNNQELGTIANIGNTALASTPLVGAVAGKLFGTSTAKKFSTDLLDQSKTFNRTLADGLYGAQGIVFKGKQAKELVDLENIRNWTGDQQLQQAQHDFLAARDTKNIINANMALTGGLDRITNFGVQAKHGAVLQFTKRTISKHKINKQQAGGVVTNEYINNLYEPQSNLTQSQIDARNELWNNTKTQRDAYNKQIEDPSFIEDWIPSKQSWREYWEQNQQKHSGEDNNIFNAVFGGDWDLTSDYFDSFYFHLLPDTEYNDDSELVKYYKTLNDEQIRNLYKNIYRIATNYRNPGIYKHGGKVNVIPSGALHAYKHNLTEIAEDGEKFENVTTKGIPVVVEDEKGNLIQQAEIEREEIIFRLEVTKKLEELAKEGTDAAAIQAGKLLVKEILNHTEDNTGELL